MKSGFRHLAMLLTAFLLLTALGGCGAPRYSEEELRAALEELLPRAAELNVVYFGEGLPLSDDPERLRAFFGAFDSDIASVNYNPVDESCGYTTEAALREATEAVFTPEYAGYLFDRAFAGISAVYNEGTETQTTTTAMYAMYIEQNGVLTARIDLPEQALDVSRVCDPSGMVLDHCGDGYAVVRLPTEKDGADAGEIEVKLVKTEGGWRLDSPTY